MDKTKLIELLKTLNKTEFERFGVFLDTPVFNERKTICRLFSEIKGFYPGFSDLQFTKEKIFNNLYLSKPYNDELMRNLISRLYKLLENYLSFINYEKDKFNMEYRLLEELHSRGHEKLFKKKFENLNKNTLEYEKFDFDSIYKHYRLSSLSLEHFFSYPYQPDVDKNILDKRKIKLIEYFLSDILNVYSMMAHDMSLHPEKKYDFDMLESITHYIEANPDYFKNNIYLQINFNVLKLLLTNNDEYYNISRKLIIKNSTMLSRSEKSKQYTALLSFIQSKIFKGDQGKLRDKFELYIEMFANEGAYHNNIIKHAEIILAVNNSLMLKEFLTAEEYVNKYIDEVESYYRQSTKYYCLGLIDYYKKEYKSALKYLLKVDYDDVSYKNLVRTLKLMIYFSMNDHEGFYSLVDSFRHFLNINKQVSPYNYEVSSNFINFTIRLFKGKEEPEKFDMFSFKREVLETNNVARKQWLIQMIEEFENEIK